MSGKTVAIVDDAGFSRGVIKRVLTEAGFTVVAEGADGYEAVEIYRKHKPDLLTLDIVMPGMDGLSALAVIMDAHPEARAIVISSVGEEGTLIEAIKLGARDYVTKPIVPDRLAEAALKAVG